MVTSVALAPGAATVRNPRRTVAGRAVASGTARKRPEGRWCRDATRIAPSRLLRWDRLSPATPADEHRDESYDDDDQCDDASVEDGRADPRLRGHSGRRYRDRLRRGVFGRKRRVVVVVEHDLERMCPDAESAERPARTCGRGFVNVCPVHDLEHVNVSSTQLRRTAKCARIENEATHGPRERQVL